MPHPLSNILLKRVIDTNEVNERLSSSYRIGYEVPALRPQVCEKLFFGKRGVINLQSAAGAKIVTYTILFYDEV